MLDEGRGRNKSYVATGWNAMSASNHRNQEQGMEEILLNTSRIVV